MRPSKIILGEKDAPREATIVFNGSRATSTLPEEMHPGYNKVITYDSELPFLVINDTINALMLSPKPSAIIGLMHGRSDHEIGRRLGAHRTSALRWRKDLTDMSAPHRRLAMYILGAEEVGGLWRLRHYPELWG
jgi:hypothetical protein